MALRWDFREKSGIVTEKLRDGSSASFNFYEGNALMIVPHEFTDEDGVERYDMRWFFIGEDHAKNCLGIAKGHENMFGPDGITSLTIYRDHCRYWKKLVNLFTRAFPGITILISASAPDHE